MTRRSSQHIPLGTVLFDWPAAGRTRAQLPYAPDTWREQFRKHADNSVLRGVFGACRAGRNWVLTNAPEIRLRLDTTREHTREEWAARIGRLEQGLRTRGNLPTCVQVECDRSLHSSIACAALVSLLTQTDISITQLRIRDSSGDGDQQNSAFSGLVHLGVPAIPNLTFLTLLDPSISTLPHPSLLPNLQKLEYVFGYKPQDWSDDFIDDCFRSIAPYVGQLQFLSIWDSEQALDPSWDLLFAAPSHTLTHFETNLALEEDLLSVLAEHMHALRHIEAFEISMAASLADKQWGVETVEVVTVEERLIDVARLPRCVTGQRLTLAGPECTMTLKISSPQVCMCVRSAHAPILSYSTQQNPCFCHCDKICVHACMRVWHMCGCTAPTAFVSERL